MKTNDEKSAVAAALQNLPAELAREVIGQDAVIRDIAEWVMDAEMGLTDKSKPRGTFMFLGPTGVGKTQLAKALNRRLAVLDNVPQAPALIRFDMSEFKTPDSVDIFLGRGAGELGRFGTAMRKAVGSRIILFDEMEKAHANILDLMLQMFDDARLTVASGETFDLRPYYGILTSNLGAGQAARMRHNSDVAVERMIVGHVRQKLRPELFARVDRVYCFRRLNLAVQAEVCRYHVSLKLRELEADGIHVAVEDSVHQWLLGEGFSEVDGARPLQRAIQTHINRPIRGALLRGQSPQGRLQVNESRNGLEFVPAAAAAA